MGLFNDLMRDPTGLRAAAARKAAEELKEKLDKFIDRVAFRVEEALQSNEIINVF